MRPLEGIRIVDFTNHAAGPYCAMLMGLLGAEVIRIESHARLDIQRRPHPVYGRVDVPNFDYLGTHKKSITLDLKKSQAQTIVTDLVRVSDVVLENFRPRVMDRLGLGWDRLIVVNPRLVMLSLSAYGSQGPYSGRPGYAPIFAAEGGLGFLTGYPDGPPGEIRNLMDHQAGLTGAFTVLSLLEARDQTGKGGWIDLAAREVAMMLVGESIVETILGGQSRRMGNGHECWVPHGVYPAKGDDAWVAISVRNDEEWRGMVEAMGSPSWCQEDFSTEEHRRRNRDAIDARVWEWTSGHQAGALVSRLQAHGVSADRSMTASDLLADEHLRSRGSITTLEHPVHGERVTVGSPWRFRHSDSDFRDWSPELGEHNKEVMQGLLGMPDETFERLVEDGVIY